MGSKSSSGPKMLVGVSLPRNKAAVKIWDKKLTAMGGLTPSPKEPSDEMASAVILRGEHDVDKNHPTPCL